MEQKRILWIVAAVGLFLLVVVGFALILYSPAQKQDPIITSNQSTNDIWASPGNANPINPNYQVSSLQGTPLENVVNGNIQSTDNSQQFSPVMSAPAQQVANQVPQGNNVLPSDSMTLNGQQQVQDVTVISGNTKVYTTGNTTVDVSGLTNNSVTQPTVTQSTSTQASTQKTVVANTTKTSTGTSTSSAKTTSTAKTSSTKPASKTTTTAATKTEAPTPKYWIQAGSYSSKKNAEEARNALSAEKIASEIFTFTDANGTLFYRVRIGPYTTKSEAEYWQSRVAMIEKFSGTKTYITDSSAKKQ